MLTKMIRIKRILNTVVETVKENNDNAKSEPKPVENKVPEKKTQSETIEKGKKNDSESN